MDTTSPTIAGGTIVVGTDGSSGAAHAVDWAADQAAREHRTLTLVHALDHIGATATAWLAGAGVDALYVRRAAEDAAAASLAAEVERVRAVHPGLEVVTSLVTGDAREVLLRASRQAPLVVVGSRGRGPLASALLGSTSAALAGRAAGPVAVVHHAGDGGRPPLRRVIVGVDGVGGSAAALEAAYRQASWHRLPLVVVRCFWDAVAALEGPGPVTPDEDVDDLRLTLAETVAGMAEKFPDVEVDLQLARGLADSWLSSAATDSDLLVLGRHDDHPLLRALTGSVAATVVERAHGVVLVVPEPC